MALPHGIRRSYLIDGAYHREVGYLEFIQFKRVVDLFVYRHEVIAVDERANKLADHEHRFFAEYILHKKVPFGRGNLFITNELFERRQAVSDVKRHRAD